MTNAAAKESYEMRSRESWDPSILANAQIGFFLLHVPMQIPAGTWAQKYGAKIVMQLSMLHCAVVSFITPFAITLGGPLAMTVFVSLQGLGQGCFIPSFYVFTSQWVPLSQRSIIFSAAFGGIHFGSAIGIPLIGGICRSRLGWWSGYVFSSMVAFVWVICSVFVMKSWVRRERISINTRKQYDNILDTIEISEKGVSVSVPWSRILTSLPVWSAMLNHFGSVWINDVFLTELTYFTQIHHISADNFNLVLPYTISMAMIPVFSICVAIMTKLEFSRTTRRKTMSSISHWGSSILLLTLSFQENTYAIAHSIFLLGAACSSSSYCGVYLNHAELSPFFAGTLMGLSNVVANSAHVIRGVSQNLIVTNPASRKQWRTSFLYSSTVTFFANLPFVLYGTCKEQPWSPNIDWMDYEGEDDDYPDTKDAHRRSPRKDYSSRRSHRSRISHKKHNSKQQQAQTLPKSKTNVSEDRSREQ